MLLEHIRNENPRQYERFAPLIDQASVELDNTGRSQIELVFRGDWSTWSPEIREAAVGALAGVLNISRDQITFLSARSGSIVLLLEMPTVAALYLGVLYETNASVIEELGIERVNIFIGEPISTTESTSFKASQKVAGASSRLNLQGSPTETPISYFDPYPLSLLILSALSSLTSTEPLEYSRKSITPEPKVSLRRQVQILIRILQETAQLLTQFKDFVKAHRFLDSEFRLGAIKVPISEEDYQVVKGLQTPAIQIYRVTTNTLPDLIPYLTSSVNGQFREAIEKFGFFSQKADLAPDYQSFLLGLRDGLGGVFDYSLKVASNLGEDEKRLARPRQYLHLLETWEIGNQKGRRGVGSETSLADDLSSRQIVQIPLIENISLDISQKVNIVGYLSLDEDYRNGADFAVVMADDPIKELAIRSGDILLFRQQPDVEKGEVAAVIIRTPSQTTTAIKQYYREEDRTEANHWFLTSGYPNGPHIVVIPSTSKVEEVENIYAKAVTSRRLSTYPKYYENGQVIVVGKYVGLVRNM